MARTGAFTNWNTLSGSTTQAPSVTEAVNITMPDGLTVYNYASKAITYRTVAYTARLKSIGPIVTQLGNGQGRVTIRLHNGDLDFRDSVEGNYVTSAGSTVFTGMEDFSGALITVRRILTGVVSSTTTSTDLVYLFGRVTGSRYSEDYFELDCVTDVNLAPVLSNRRVGAKCAWVFKGTECGYSGGLTTCNKLYTDSGGCSGRSNQHRFGGFPVRDSAAAIGKVTGLGSAATYQLVQSGTTYQEQRMITAFDDSFGVVDDSGNDRTVVTAITPDWINAQSTTYKASGSDTTTTGSITSGTATLTVASATSWKVGQGIRIAGAGAAGAALTTTISAISGTTFTLAANASTTVSSAVVGHDDTAAVQAAFDAGNTNDKTVYLPTGTYYVDELDLLSVNSLQIIGAGPGATILRSRGNNAILDINTTSATSHTITIEGISFIGSAAEATVQSNNYGVRIRDTGGHGVYNVTIRNCRFSDCDNSAIKTTSGTNATFTVLLEGVDVTQPSDAVGDAIDLWGSNDTTLVRCYVHSVATNKAAYRVRSGSITMIGCNGIDGGSFASWGMFGNTASEDGDVLGTVSINVVTDVITLNNHGLSANQAVVFDGTTNPGNITFGLIYYVRDVTTNTFKVSSTPGGTAINITSTGTAVTVRTALDNYCRVSLIGCNVEAFSEYGIRCKAGSFANFFSTQFIAPTTGTVIPIKMDYVTADQAGIFDALSSIQTMGASYSGGEAVHSDGMPFVQVGNRELTSFYDTAGAASASLPGITGTRITGTQQFAMTHTGYQKLVGHLAMEEQSSPVTPPSNTGFLFAKDASGATGLYWVSDGVTERRIDIASAGLTATRIGFGDGSNVMTGSANLTYDDSAKALTLTRAGANPAIYVTDTTNTITARLGTLAGAPDRAIVGSDTNDDFVIYQNNQPGWGVNTDKHFRPYNGNNTQDIATSAARARSAYIGTSIDLGISSSSQGQLIFRTTATGFTTTVEGGSNTGNITFKLPVTNGTDGQYLRAYGNGLTNWFTPPYASETLNNLADPVAINRGLQPGTDNTLDLGQNSLSWASLYLKKDAYVGRHLQGGTLETPTLTRGDGAGTTWSATITGNQMCGYITFTTGSSPSSNATVFTMTFGTAFVGPASVTGWPIVNLIPCNVNAATLGANSQLYPDHDSKSSTTAVFKIHSNGLSANTEYRFYYMVMGTC